jgi:S-adenosylmethionine synthetase
MPMPITLAHNLAKRIDFVREQSIIEYLKPDGKTQVTVNYYNGKPVSVSHVVLAIPHEERIGLNYIANEAFKHIVKPVFDDFGFKINEKKVIVNGTGVWHFSGPAADTGVTGRKIVVDTYGGYARVGGGAFSGKDPTKVDRSGAYAARFLAKNIVANNLADKVEVMLAYFIGAKKPSMIEIETFDTAKKSRRVVFDFAKKFIDFSVEGILERLNLRRPIYLPTACYGHFGRKEFPWEVVL